ncbi:NCK-interacting protein with SH3 domain [Anopheles ziemanni]|uniref:NCK-interacting protein with SH3 domain n=1 Tax=Anopheles coustani TaxID=139045 RepID=UPI00265A08A8|nr:NCK-interacting protein with SH3 domain [Anopheles coustani]XP_058175493.1 NCK-interacting protein with SH3 domain [Anopheles ziemanni]
MAADSLSQEAECFEMLKALYDFTAVYPKTISFDEGEYFILHQTSARQRNWWQVVSMKGNIGFVPSNYVIRMKVNPNFLNGFLESSIESLRLSTDKEINGIIGREELISRLVEKKRKLEKLLKYEQSDSESEPPSPQKISNGHIKQLDGDDRSQQRNDMQRHSTPMEPQQVATTAKKSMSSPAVGAQAQAAVPPQFIQESPSTGLLATKGGQPEPEPLTPTGAYHSVHEPSSTLSEVSSEAEPTSNNTATTGTLTTTSDEITAISRVDERGQPGEPPGMASSGGVPSEAENQTDHEPDELETTNNDDVTVSENEPQPASEPSEPRVPSSGAELAGDGGKADETLPPANDGTAERKSPEADEAIPSVLDDELEDRLPPVAPIEAAEVYQIVDAIRNRTRLSHELSSVALRVVLSELEALVPAQVGRYFEPFAVHLAAPLDVPDTLLGQTHDAHRLRVIFAELSDCKNDSEQRTWMLHEDEADISQYLAELIRILTDADPKICRSEMACDHYQSIINLVLYYQMETRWSIRKLLLKAFRAMCHLDYTTVDILLGSVLPLELVQDMVSNPRNIEKLQELANMLIIIFSIGRRMPINQQDHLRADFVIFLLNLIETPPECDVQEVLPDIMINLILSFNLQFDNFTDNVVLEAIEQFKTAKTFTEKILLLINREEDPVHTLKHTPVSINPVLKMLVDLFSRPETASIFYTNDNKVLIDILVRQLSDLSAGEPIRKWYLELCRKILRNTNYPEHQHRKQDLMKIFTRIFCEETECSASDQQIVREIANEFPQIFKA